MEKCAIDLLWLRPGKVGGTESFIRNLLKGFMSLDEEFCVALLVSRDNMDSFTSYLTDERFEILTAPIYSNNISKRIIWQNVYQNNFLRKNKINKCFTPVYCKPWFNGGIEYICVIHDLQAYHYPQYHPFHEVLYSRVCWYMDVHNAKRVIAISNWVREDIISKYGNINIDVIYNPVYLDLNNVASFSRILYKYNIEEKNYLYTISQIIPHKNLKTLLHLLRKILDNSSKEYDGLPQKLVITGVSGNAISEINNIISELHLEGNVVFTGRIDDAVRNTLYINSYAFLFPSVFEGFGMPPVEAMICGVPTITTRCASIPEITQNKAIYVDDPFDVDEWFEKLLNIDRFNSNNFFDYEVYSPIKIAQKYLEIIKND